MHPAPKQNKTPKIVQVYEAMLQHEELPKSLLQPLNASTNNDAALVNACWQKFFLLQPNIEALQKELERLDEHRLHSLKPFLNLLWTKCMQQVNADVDKPADSSVNALVTLCSLIQVLSKKKLSSRSGSLELLEAVTASSTDVGFEKLLAILAQYVAAASAVPVTVLKAGFTLLVLILASHDNALARSSFFDVLMKKMPIFEILTLNVLTIPKMRSAVGNEALTILSWCCNHRCDDDMNPYAAELSLLDDEARLTGYCQVVATSFEGEINKFIDKYGSTGAGDQARSGLMSSIASAVGSWFSSAVPTQRVYMDSACRSQLHVLLAMYFAVRTNRAFMVILLQSLIRYYDDDDSLKPITPGENAVNVSSSKRDSIPSLSSDGEPPLTPSSCMGDNTPDYYRSNSMFCRQPSANLDDNSNGLAVVPSNLFVLFVEFFSVIMHDTKSETAKMATRLSFMTLTTVCEDQFVQSWLHDSNICYRVRILRAPLRHQRSAGTGGAASQAPSFFPAAAAESRAASATQQQNNSTLYNRTELRPLCHALLDLVQEYMTSHFIVKQFPFDNYMLALTITHRLIVYEKQNQIRIDYPWRLLWECLCSLLKFLNSNYSHLYQRLKLDTFSMCDRVVNIFNLFITCGDHFLQDGFAYDQLYYEIIRQRYVFEELCTKCCLTSTIAAPIVSSSIAASFKLGSTTDADATKLPQTAVAAISAPLYKRSATMLFNHLVNIRGILGHICPAVEAAVGAPHGNTMTSLTEEQVLRIVRSSYASLTLRILDTINVVEKYDESVADSDFISQVVTLSMQQARRVQIPSAVEKL